MKLLFSLILFIIFLQVSEVKAQIAMAVAKDKKQSSLAWRLEWGCSKKSSCMTQARKYLKSQGHNSISNQAEYDVSNGFYVVVKTKYKLYDDSYKTSYGMGASSSSYEDAEAKAVENLRIHDWTWEKSYGYAKEESKTF